MLKKLLFPMLIILEKDLHFHLLKKPWLFFDVFAACRVKSLRDLLGQANIKFVYVPASCTSELQPLDRSLNYPYRTVLKQCFIDWYGAKVKETLDKGAEVNVSMPTSIIKELYAKRLIKTHSEMEKKKELILSGFEQSGVSEYCMHAC